MAAPTTTSREGYNAHIESIRQHEYPMLQDALYLDHAGTTLCSKSLMDAFSAEMTSVLYGNPHSGSWPSQLSALRIQDIRLHLLDFFKADPADYDLVFVANATAGVKLVLEGLASLPQGFSYVHHQACHTSLVGVREQANESTCIDDAGLAAWLQGVTPLELDARDVEAATVLFAYPAQSHLDGTRYPLDWSTSVRKQSQAGSRIYTLLDAASFCATSPLDLSHPDVNPDFTVLSLYKIFGFPDLGALIVRRDAAPVFDHRKYFGGGTVDMAVCGREKWHAPKSDSLHDRLEDGTLPFHSIMAVDSALKAHQKLFGSMLEVKKHATQLTRYLNASLCGMKHANGNPVCALYSREDGAEQNLDTAGPVVAFNLRQSSGAWVSLEEFEKLANLKKVYVRTGSMCSPGGIASALNLAPWEMRKNFSAGFRCGQGSDIMNGKPTGVIRVSVGAMSTTDDIERFIAFIKEFFMDEEIQPINPPVTGLQAEQEAQFRVKSISVYPLKSCRGFVVPPSVVWGVRPEGLSWDREWCLVHQGSGQALSQKRYPQMALLQPTIDLDHGVLKVHYRGPQLDSGPDYITVPLSADPTPFGKDFRHVASRVCGEKVSAMAYTCGRVNGFFTKALGVPCTLVRFPPGGQGLTSRSIKARKQKHQQGDVSRLAQASSDIPSPPDSDVESSKEKRILLSNESPILMINSSSVQALNEEIISRGSQAVSEATFRGNIVIEKSVTDNDSCLPYAEDFWDSVDIGEHHFKLLGACQRCHMVCIDQETAEKRQEPFVTLAKTRRLDGKVYFGVHMRHEPNKNDPDQEYQVPTIQVGQHVRAHRMP